MFIYLKVSKIHLSKQEHVHMINLDFVEVTNGYVSICKEAILGNCLINECKFIIFVLKNFNGKFSLLITIKLGIRTSILLSQIPFPEKILHINPFSLSLSILTKKSYVHCSLFVFSFVFLLSLFLRTHTYSIPILSLVLLYFCCCS